MDIGLCALVAVGVSSTGGSGNRGVDEGKGDLDLDLDLDLDRDVDDSSSEISLVSWTTVSQLIHELSVPSSGKSSPESLLCRNKLALGSLMVNVSDLNETSIGNDQEVLLRSCGVTLSLCFRVKFTTKLWCQAT